MRLDADDFELFGLPRRYALAGAEIDARWKAMQARVHPDRFAAEGGAAQRVAMQWAVRVNEAYRRLSDPLQRAAYLCELQGAPINAEHNTAMPHDFLVQQLHWREALDEVASHTDVQALERELAADRGERVRRLADLLDTSHDPRAAAAEVRALMFIERFAEDIDRRSEALGE